MRYVFVAYMLIASVIAGYLSTRIIYMQNYKKKYYRAFSALALSSCLWSLGYGVMYLTEFESYYYIFRVIGIIGLFSFLIAGQVILLYIGSYAKRYLVFTAIEGLIGFGVVLTIMNPSSISLYYSKMGFYSVFNSALVSNIYTIYIACVGATFVTITVQMAKSEKKHSVQAFGKQFLIVVGLILFGVIFDTILPAFGINLGIPSSTMMQFIGLEVVYRSVHMISKSSISTQNMAGYIYRSLKTSVLIFDADNKLRLVNKEAKQLLDITSENDKDLELIDFWGDIYGGPIPEGLSTSHETIGIRWHYEKKDKYCSVYVDSIFDDFGDFIGYIVTILDVTYAATAMMKLEQSEKEAQMANQAKSAFLANMSHEIRTPMNAILGFSEIALRSETDPVSREYFLDIHGSASTLLGIINDILDISKVESGKMELDIFEYITAELFDEVYAIISMQASRKALVFKMNIEPDFPKVLLGDKAKIRQILINLLNNSIKYTNEGSVSLTASYLDGKVHFVIKDTGIGIKEEDMGSIFSSFQRLDLQANRNTEGTGLGLSITEAFVKLMDGTIDVSSEYGVGSTFTVVFEQKIGTVTPLKKNTPKTVNKEFNFENLKVLAVDDNKLNLKLINKILTRYGVQVELAESGAQSVELCSSKEYDFVLMDQMMPEMDGVEAMKKIRELGGVYAKGGTSKIVALTANEITGAREELLEEGFDDFLGKPVDIKALETCLMQE